MVDSWVLWMAPWWALERADARADDLADSLGLQKAWNWAFGWVVALGSWKAAWWVVQRGQESVAQKERVMAVEWAAELAISKVGQLVAEWGSLWVAD